MLTKLHNFPFKNVKFFNYTNLITFYPRKWQNSFGKVVNVFWEFYLYRDVNMTCEGLQILNYAQQLWPLSWEVLKRATPTVTSVYNGYLGGPETLTPIVERLAVDLSIPVCYDLRMLWLGFEHPTHCLWVERINRLRHCCSETWFKLYI